MKSTTFSSLNVSRMFEKRRTTFQQFKSMVTFMEKHGDLSKAVSGSENRHITQQRWQELCRKLNQDKSCGLRSEEKWRKVWSDLKSNTKKKWEKISEKQRQNMSTVQQLTDLEQRVLAIMEIPVQQVLEGNANKNDTHRTKVDLIHTQEDEAFDMEQSSDTDIKEDEDWNAPGTSGYDPLMKSHLSPDEASVSSSHTSPPKPKHKSRKNTRWRPYKKIKIPREDELLNEYQRSFNYERERDRRQYELEKERIRQRDEELKLQREWLELMKSALGVVERYLAK